MYLCKIFYFVHDGRDSGNGEHGAKKLTIFAPHSGTCDSEPPTHTPKSGRALRSGIPSLLCKLQKKSGPLTDLPGEFLEQFTKNAQKTGSTLGGDCPDPGQNMEI